jgi:FkbM family methyltransferase
MDKYVDFSKVPNHIKRIKLDVGLSYSAPHSQIWLDNNKENDLYVFGFEPNPECYNSILNKNIKKQNEGHSTPIENKYIDDNKYFKVIPVALSNNEKEQYMDFYAMKNDCGTSSLFKPIDLNLGEVKEVVKVPVFSLKHFFDLFDWERFPIIEYLKIDAQGADLDIIKGAGDYITRIVYITAEPESENYLNNHNNTVTNMINYLEKYDFIPIQHQNTGDPTFINKKFIHLKDDIFICQCG